MKPTISWLLMLCALCMVGAVAGGTCTGGAPLVWTTASTHYELRPMGVRLRPMQGSEPTDIGELKWEITVLTERNKTTTTVSGQTLTAAACVPPKEDFTGEVDPLQPADPFQTCPGAYIFPCGALSTYMRVSDMNCESEEVQETIEGVNVKSLYVKATHPTYPDFVTHASYHLADDDIQVNRSYINGIQQTIFYYKDSLKVAYNVSSWPWSYDWPAYAPTAELYNGAAFMSIYFNLYLRADVPATALFSTPPGGRETTVTLLSSNPSVDGELRLNAGLETNVVTDNRLFVAGGFVPVAELPLPLAAGLPLNITATIPICAPVTGHWGVFEYDPSLSALFSPPPTPQAEPGNGAPKGISQGAIAGIALGVIGFLLIAVVIIGLLYMKVPAVKNFLRPFAARQSPAGAQVAKERPHVHAHNEPDTADASTRPPGKSVWAAAAKPANV